MAYAHRGMRELNGDEIAAASLGQCGFKLITNTNVEAGVTAGYEDIEFFIAIKAVNGTATVKAQSLIGDDFSQDGAYSGTAIAMADGDVVHGTFDKITVASGDHVIAYIGR